MDHLQIFQSRQIPQPEDLADIRDLVLSEKKKTHLKQRNAKNVRTTNLIFDIYVIYGEKIQKCAHDQPDIELLQVFTALDVRQGGDGVDTA